ncbi:MAG: hypothetical protein K1X82_03065 [Bacteroidia bacterium]|nr:hypothetical protein [Bacteroidia bacterium]
MKKGILLSVCLTGFWALAGAQTNTAAKRYNQSAQKADPTSVAPAAQPINSAEVQINSTKRNATPTVTKVDSVRRKEELIPGTPVKNTTLRQPK